MPLETVEWAVGGSVECGFHTVECEVQISKQWSVDAKNDGVTSAFVPKKVRSEDMDWKYGSYPSKRFEPEAGNGGMDRMWFWTLFRTL